MLVVQKFHVYLFDVLIMDNTSNTLNEKRMITAAFPSCRIHCDIRVAFICAYLINTIISM